LVKLMIIIIVIVIAPFRSQIFKIFFASGSKGALTPLTKILRTPLTVSKIRLHGIFRRADVIERERTGNICCWHVYALSTRDVTNLSPSSSAALTSAAEVKKCRREVTSGQHTHLSVENSEVRTEEHRRIRATTTLTSIIISNNRVFSSTPITS